MVILIVDSSIQIIERLEEILSEAENITAIHKAVSYQEAAKLFKEIKHDLVLLDSGLPGNGWIDLLKEIKGTSSTTPVIVLANHLDNHNKEKCKFLGADFFFDKYHDFEKIPRVINAITGNKNK